jgi:hypothetical protein
MSRLAPPPLQPLTAAGDDGMRRLQFRVWQVWISTLTTLIAVWFLTFGVLPGIIAIVVAKHVLVAVYLIGINVYPAYKDDEVLRESDG